MMKNPFGFLKMSSNFIALFIAVLGAFLSSEAHAVTYSGTLYEADGKTKIKEFVDFTVTLYDPSRQCLLLQERHKNVNLLKTLGKFRLYVADPILKVAERVAGVDPGLTSSQVFATSGTVQIIPPSEDCPNGFTPKKTDYRYMRVMVTKLASNTTITLSPDLAISPVTKTITNPLTEKLALISIDPAVDGTYVNNSNKSSFTVNGYCATNGTNIINVLAGSIVLPVKLNGQLAGTAVDCVQNRFNGVFDLSGVKDGLISLTAKLLVGTKPSVSTALKVTKDVVVPKGIAILAPKSGFVIDATNETAILLSGNCTEKGTSNVTFSSGMTSLGALSCTGRVFTGKLSFAQLNAGQISLTAKLSDLAGNSIVSAPVNISKIKIAPKVVKITTPLNNTVIGKTYQSGLPIMGECSEDGTENIVIKANSAPLEQPINCTGGIFNDTFDITGFNDGPITLTATMTAADRTVVNSSVITIKKDSISEETVSITNPLQGVNLSLERSKALIISGECSQENFGNIKILANNDVIGYANCTGISYTGTFDISKLDDGPVQFQAVLLDYDGNEVPSNVVSIVKDTAPPTFVTIQVPVSGAFINSLTKSAFTVSGQCSSDGVSVAISANGTLIKNAIFDCVEQSFSGSIDFSAFRDMSIELKAILSDIAGNVLTSSGVTVIKDVVPPTLVTIGTTIQGTWINNSNQGSFPIFGNCSNRGNNVKILANGNQVGSLLQCSTSGNYTSNLVLSDIADGPVVLKAVHYDSAQNYLESSELRFTKSSVLPSQAAITQPVPGEYINASEYKSFPISGTCSEVGTGNVKIYANSVLVSDSQSCLSDGTFTAGAVNLSALKDGIVKLTAVITNSAGNKFTSQEVNVNLDTVAPISVSISTPVASSYINKYTYDQFEVTGNCSEPVGGKVTILADGVQVGDSYNCNNGKFTASPLRFMMADRTILLSAVHTDFAGNSIISPTVSVIKDIESPKSIDITSPQQNSYISIGNLKAFSVTGSCSNELNNTVTLQLNDFKVVTSCANGTFTKSIDLSNVPIVDGPVSLTATYADKAGNRLDSSAVNLTRDLKPPSAPSISIENGAAATSLREVTLNLSASDQPAEMYITNKAGCASGMSWEPYQAVRAKWPLAQLNSIATVYVKFRDAALNESECQSDTILHDDLPPPVPSAPALLPPLKSPGKESMPIFRVSNVVIGDIISIHTDSTCTTPSLKGSVKATATTVDIKSIYLADDNTYVFYSKATDSVGNENCAKLVGTTYILDRIQPDKPTIVINNGDLGTNQSQVRLSISSTETPYQMYITNTPGCETGGLGWENYATSKTWLLSSLNTTSTVYIKTRDLAGNESFCESDSILHDSLPPSDPITMNLLSPTQTFDQNTTPSIELTGLIPGDRISLHTDGACTSQTLKASADVTDSLMVLKSAPLTEGFYLFFVRLTDPLNNSICSPKSVPYSLDLTPPTISITTPPQSTSSNVSAWITSASIANLYKVEGACTGVGGSVVVRVTGSDAGFSTTCVANGTTGKWTLYLAPNFAPEGPLAVTFTVYHADLARNMATPVSVLVTKDTLPPSEISIVNSIEINSINMKSFPIGGNCSEEGASNVVVQVYSPTKLIFETVGSALACSKKANDSITFNGAIDLSARPDGLIRVRAIHSDLAGNSKVSDVVSINKDTSAPVGTTFVIEDGATVTSKTSVSLKITSPAAPPAEMYFTSTAGCGSGEAGNLLMLSVAISYRS